MEELKEMVIQTLDVAGVLDKIRAQLRLNVFKVVQSEEPKTPAHRVKAVKAVSTPQGALSAALFCDFFDTLKMKYSLNVFIPECHFEQTAYRQFITKELGLELTPGVPALITLIQGLSKKNPKEEKKDPPKPEVLKKEPIRSEPPRKEVIKSEPPKREPYKEEPARKEPVKKEPQRNEPQRKDDKAKWKQKFELDISDSNELGQSDEIEGERQRLMDIDRRLHELDSEDQHFEISGDIGSSDYEEEEDPSFVSDMLQEFDHVENAI